MQDRLTIQEYLIRLEILFKQAQLMDEREKTHILKKNIDPDILHIVYNNDTLPNTYDEWKERIGKVGMLQEDLRQIQKQRTPTQMPPSTTKPTMSKYNIILPPHTDKKTPTGVTYGRQGQPMEIDQLKNTHCYNCDELGHLCNQCPKPKKKLDVREMWMQLDDKECDDFYIQVWAMDLEKEREDFEKAGGTLLCSFGHTSLFLEFFAGHTIIINRDNGLYSYIQYGSRTMYIIYNSK